MNLAQSIILGIVEGVTEFLPISSTAHLIITSKLLHISQTEFQKFFEVFIQSGAILAVIFLYARYVKKHPAIIKNIATSFIPTALVGFLLYEVIKNIFFESNSLIAAALLAVGLLFIVVEQKIKGGSLTLKKTLSTLDIKTAVFIGLAQSLAVIPGVSRAGIVIVVMILMGYERDDAAIYSFLLAVPTIIAASVLDLYKSRELLSTMGAADSVYLGVGFVVSFVTAYISVKWLTEYLKKNSLTPFGIYRLVLAIIVFIVLGQ